MKAPLRIVVLVFFLFLKGLVSAVDGQKWNVLFIAVDDLRPEWAASGTNILKTPNLDRIAARGTTFDRAYCQQAVCSPSRSSLLTGRRPDATRVWDLETHFRKALPEAITIPQHFKNNGYFTQGIGKIFHHGFDDPPSWSTPWQEAKAPQYASERALQAMADPANKDARGRFRGPATESAEVADDFYKDGKVAQLAAKTLSKLNKEGQPFFLAVGMARPHLPFVAPKKYWDVYDPSAIYTPAFEQIPEGAPLFVGHTNGEVRSYSDIPKTGPIPESIARHLRRGYYASASYMDAQVGLVLDALEREGLEKKTVIVLWGDHGWQLGEHGLWHKHTNFEVAVRSPLLISVPDQKAPGKKTKSLAEFVDVYPTLAEACGLQVPSGLDGVSLMPILNDPRASVRSVAISQYPRVDAGKSLMGYSIRDSQWRLTLWRDRSNHAIHDTELYDENGDPHETRNLAAMEGFEGTITRLSKFLPAPIPPATSSGELQKSDPGGRKKKSRD